jgi:hypothetical protein
MRSNYIFSNGNRQSHSNKEDKTSWKYRHKKQSNAVQSFLSRFIKGYTRSSFSTMEGGGGKPFQLWKKIQLACFYDNIWAIMYGLKTINETMTNQTSSTLNRNTNNWLYLDALSKKVRVYITRGFVGCRIRWQDDQFTQRSRPNSHILNL